MTDSPKEKEAKQEDFECEACNKSFTSQVLYESHVRTKHASKEDEPIKTKVETPPQPQRLSTKTKANFEQYQQDLEDKIYAFLGELGEKNALTSEDVNADNAEDSDKVAGQANYLDNCIVRTPYEAEFDVTKTLDEVIIPSELVSTELAENFKKEIAILWQKLAAERETWQFCDPIEMYKMENEEFSLVNIPSVIRNYKKKEIGLAYPEHDIFVLWLTKTCKAAAWKELYTVVAYINSQYFDFRKKGGASKDKTAWKAFTNELLPRLEKETPKDLLKELTILKQEDVSALSKLYSKWVSYFGLD